jgi:hypothetical protein
LQNQRVAAIIQSTGHSISTSFELRQAQRLHTTSSHILSPDKDAQEEEMDRVQITDNTTYSKEAVPLVLNSRKKRKDYPLWASLGSTTNMEKRVLKVFDGERVLDKDDIILDTNNEIRTKSGAKRAYVTDLDVQTMQRVDALHDTMMETTSPWISDDLTELDVTKLTNSYPFPASINCSLHSKDYVPDQNNREVVTQMADPFPATSLSVPGLNYGEKEGGYEVFDPLNCR